MSKILSQQEAFLKREQLVSDGYTIIPNILKDPLLSKLKNWSTEIFNRVPVDPRYKYQGSDIHVYTEKAWNKMDIKADEKRFPDPIVEELINYPDQIQICDEIGLENLKPRDNVILLLMPVINPDGTSDEVAIEPNQQAKLVNGFLEKSNVNAIEEMVNTIDQQRKFEMHIKFIQMAEELDSVGSSLMRLPGM